MGQLHSPMRPRNHNGRAISQDHGLDRRDLEIGALREENSELRKLVVELSKLVIRNVVEQKH